MQTDLFEQHEDRSEVWQVSDLTREIKRLLHTEFPVLWVRGEISNLRAHPSGHRYFVLKDSHSQLKAVLFRGTQVHSDTLRKKGKSAWRMESLPCMNLAENTNSESDT